jgi:hypothetical protein
MKWLFVMIKDFHIDWDSREDLIKFVNQNAQEMVGSERLELS